MLRRFCSFGLEFKNSDGYTHDWVSLLPALEIAYNSSKHSSSKFTIPRNAPNSKTQQETGIGTPTSRTQENGLKALQSGKLTTKASTKPL
jgi:hypothetical protein